jgi:hypothetical protein
MRSLGKSLATAIGAVGIAISSYGCDLNSSSNIVSPEQEVTVSNPCIDYANRLSRPAQESPLEIPAENTSTGKSYYPYGSDVPALKLVHNNEYSKVANILLTDIFTGDPVTGHPVHYEGEVGTTDKDGIAKFGTTTGISECYPEYSARPAEVPTIEVLMVQKTEIASPKYNNDLLEFTTQVVTGHNGLSYHFDREHPTLNLDDPTRKIRIFISPALEAISDITAEEAYEGTFGSYELGDQVTHPLYLPLDAHVNLGLELALGGKDMFDLVSDSLTVDIRVIDSAPDGGGNFSNITYKMIALNELDIGILGHELLHHLTGAFNSGHSKDVNHILAPGGGREPGKFTRDELLMTLLLSNPINLTHYQIPTSD